MIVMSDPTALSAISTVVNTGRKPPPGHPRRAGPITVAGDTTRDIPRNTSSGIAIDPNNPSGSRAKILISSHVSFARDLSVIVALVTDRVSCQFEEYILEVRSLAPKLGHLDPMFRDAADDDSDEVLAAAAQREAAAVLLHRLQF